VAVKGTEDIMVPGGDGTKILSVKVQSAAVMAVMGVLAQLSAASKELPTVGPKK